MRLAARLAMSMRRVMFVALLVAGTAAATIAQSSMPLAVEKGFQALQQGEIDSAGSIFREGLTRYPRDPFLLFGSGVVAQMQGETQTAIALLKRALQIEPRLAQASAALAELLYQQGDVELAIKEYERAIPNAPPSIALSIRQRVEALRAEASLPQNYAAIKDDRFMVSFDGPVQEKLAERATSVLTAAFWRIGKTLGTYPSAPINVILYSQRQFHDFTGAPEWSAGAFDGQIRMPVKGAAQNLAEFDRVLTHELTHAMLRTEVPRNLPAWLNEGLAMYCEGKDGELSGRRLAAARVFVPLAALQTSFGRLTAAQAVVAYEESAFAARALIERIGPANLGQLLQDLSGGQTIEQAIERFGVTFAAFESDLERRIRGKNDSAR